MRISILLSAASVCLALTMSGGLASAKTAKECNADYAANKGTVKASGQTKAAYVAACRADNAAEPAAAAPAAAPAAAAPASAKTAKECSAEYSENKAAIKAGGQKKADFIAACRAGTETVPTAAAPAAPAAAPAAAEPAPMAPKAAAPMTASESQAQASCPGDLVVWVNTKSHIYHFKGTRDYGHTKAGTYSCEGAAKSSGSRAAENEKHP
jgi:hypothetical protein